MKKEEVKETEVKKPRAKKSPIEKLLAKVIKAKEEKYGLKYDDVKSPEYQSYCLYTSTRVETYGQYKHYASFYGNKILSKAELFKWYKMFFEVRTDMLFAQVPTPTKEGLLNGFPKNSTKWSPAELRELKKYVLEEACDEPAKCFEKYGVKAPKEMK